MKSSLVMKKKKEKYGDDEMTFCEKLIQVMSDLNLNQKKVSELTGKSKGSISNYISGKQIPPEDVQKEIAISLGLEPEYFAKKDGAIMLLQKNGGRSGIIPKLDVEAAAKIMGMSSVTVRKGLQQGVFPWGYAIQTSKNRWVYFINENRFMEIEKLQTA